jgi:hypothetical protein
MPSFENANGFPSMAADTIRAAKVPGMAKAI